MNLSKMTPLQLCSLANITATELATRARVDRKTVVRVLSGRSNRVPNYASIECVAVAMNQRLDELKRERIPIERFHRWIVGRWEQRREAKV